MLENKKAVENILFSLQSQTCRLTSNVQEIPNQQSFLANHFEQQYRDLACAVAVSEADTLKMIENDYSQKCDALKTQLSSMRCDLEWQEDLMTAATDILEDENNFQV